jgi:anhydro-N-acetylmuramic acid kinase
MGVMTGTSCDGLDAACIELSEGGTSWSPLWSRSRAFPSSLRARVLAAQKPGKKLKLTDWLELDRDLGAWYARTIDSILGSAGRSESLPLAIANHGQTLAHHPELELTLQMGEPTRIAAATGLTVICGFRNGDLAAGGQGAPLVPIFHRVLARGLGPLSKGRTIHNVGGVSNFSYFNPEVTLAFDTGPGNFWIDAAAELATRGKARMDRGGKLASQGQVDESAVRAILRHPFFSRRPPKSTGRDEFPFSLLRGHTRAKGADLVATATAVTVESMTLAYERHVLGRGLPLAAVHLCGGGAFNPMLVEGLQAKLAPHGVLVSQVRDPQLIEAQAFAYCGYMALRGHPVGGEWTGARSFGPPAHIIPGENWADVIQAISRTSKPRHTRSPR